MIDFNVHGSAHVVFEITFRFIIQEEFCVDCMIDSSFCMSGGISIKLLDITGIDGKGCYACGVSRCGYCGGAVDRDLMFVGLIV